MSATTSTGKKVELKLVRSVICCPPWMRTVVRTLGLRKMHQRKVVVDNKAIRGMVARVPHLVSISEVKE